MLSLSVFAQLLLPVTAVPTFASSVTSATFTGGTGTVTVSGTLYAKNLGALTLTVITSSDTKCVDVTGAFTGHQTASTAKSSWTFTSTAATGNGVQTVTAAASPNFNAQNNQCTGQTNAAPGSYVLDNTGPTVTASLTPAPNAAGWNSTNVSITWSATDAGSGVASGPTPASDSQNGSTSGTTKTSNATDRLGNTGAGSVTVKLDKTNPTITGTSSPTANTNGWNNTDVTVSFTCSDTPSGIKSCAGPTTLSTSGSGQSVTGTAADNADNGSSTTVSGINIDKVAPSLTGTPTTSPNAAGWYNGNVAIQWTASDALSGLAGSVPSNSTISGEGSALTASASVSDKAGNTTNATSPAVKIDKTAPNTTATLPATSWSTTNVTVSLSATDALSGPASTFYTLDGGAQQTGTSVPVTTDGTHNIQFWSVDNAGNLETAKTAQVKVDKSAPTITHVQSPTANANGWNRADTTVTFSCSDATSGIASCSAPTTATVETAGQVVNGTATDNAGNSASDSATVKLDKTPPTLSGAPTSSPNADGWYNAPVTIHWTAADALSGLDPATVPADSTISSEGTALTAAGSVSDRAGNPRSALSSPAINIDRTAPNTIAVALSPSNWNNSNVTVQLQATDNLSGVKATNFALDGGTQQSGTSVVISTDGIHTLDFSSVDVAGNVEATKHLQVKIDKTPPTINHTQSPTANAFGWDATDVTVTFICSDALSGIATCTAPQTVTIEGKDQPAPGTAFDVAGNSTTDPATVSIDKTAPSISAAADRDANTDAWYKADVLVSFTCGDALSGVVTCPASVLVGEGANQSANGTDTDAAGNTASVSLHPLNVDKTAPTIQSATDRSPNGNNWYQADVVVTFTCADTPSGIKGCSQPATLGEGTDQSASGTATDLAGNTATVNATGINVDKTAPEIVGNRAPAANTAGWNNAPVTVSFACSDSLSGVAACQAPTTLSGDAAAQFVNGNAADKAGNTASASVSGINIDTVAPTIQAAADRVANDKGWYNAEVTVSFSCLDGLSGIATCPAAKTLGEGAGQSTSGMATDVAGNTGQSASVSGINIDAGAPTLSGAATTAPNSNGWYSADVIVHWTASDALSGLDGVAPQDSTIVGEGDNLSASASASDLAGNTASTTISGIKIDRNAPTTTASVPAPLTSGWYAGAVQVTLAGHDSLSGVATTFYSVDGGARQTYAGPFSHNQKGSHVITFWSVDQAGNTEDNTAASNAITLKIDDIPPSTGATMVPNAPNGNNLWYTTAVDITLSAADAESGVDRTYYAVNGGDAQLYAGTFTFNQTGSHTISYWSVDKAGNVENAAAKGNSLSISFDNVPPTIAEAGRTPTPNAFGWNKTDVTVSFVCADATSGTASCADATISTEGANQSAVGTATDNAGNSGSLTVTGFNIDKTKPTLSGAPTTPANAAGWYKDDVTIHWTGQDGLSLVDPATQPANSAITGEGSNLDAGPVTIADKAGNVSDPASVSGFKIDRNGLVIQGAATTTPAAAANGWYSSLVTVHFTCSDPNLADGTSGSGQADCPSDAVISANGANQSVTSGEATDKAGNTTAGRVVGGINIDGTPPQTSANNACDGGNGWCRGQTATVVLTAVDQPGLSGVKEIHYFVNGGQDKTALGATTSIIVPLAAKSGLATVEYFAVDNAGNKETRSGVSLKYDNIAPTVTHTLSPVANAASWNNANTTVHFDAKDDDGGSGVDPSTVTTNQLVSTETAGLLVNGQAKDLAGNTGTDSVTVMLDKTAPTISGAATTAPNANGWYSGPVTVQFTCNDALSGIATCPANLVVTTAGANQSVTSNPVLDKAGNTNTTSVGGLNIDNVKPTITISAGSTTSAALQDGSIYNLGPYTLGAAPALSCTGADALSGTTGACSLALAGGLANGVGTFTFIATVTDKAGNTARVTGSYNVQYRFDGFLQPINDTAHQTGLATSIFKGGSTVPAKLQLMKADGTIVQANSLPQWPTPARGAATTAPVDETVYTDTGTSGTTYRWDSTAQQYIYNWSTKGSTIGYYYRAGVTLDDGQTYYVNIGLK